MLLPLSVPSLFLALGLLGVLAVVVSGFAIAAHWIAAVRLRTWDPTTGEVLWPEKAQSHLRARGRWRRWKKGALVFTFACLLLDSILLYLQSRPA